MVDDLNNYKTLKHLAFLDKMMDGVIVKCNMCKEEMTPEFVNDLQIFACTKWKFLQKHKLVERYTK